MAQQGKAWMGEARLGKEWQGEVILLCIYSKDIKKVLREEEIEVTSPITSREWRCSY